MKAPTTLFVVGMFLTTPALADDVDDVQALELEHLAALNAGNVDGYVNHHAEGRNAFLPFGFLDTDTREEQRKNRQATLDAGIKINNLHRHLEVKVYGNAAVVTGYVLGTRTSPDGRSTQRVLRRSAMWIKQDG